MTNAEKFVEVFGTDLKRQYATKSWWDQEFVAPRECKTCKHSKEGHINSTETCHLCMWSNQYKSNKEETDMSDYILSLEEAAKILKKHCEMTEACKECIFYHNDAPNMNHCKIMDTPETWPVNKIFNREENNE